MTRVALPGSRREPLPGARALRPAAAEERLEVTVMLRPGGAELWQVRLEKLARGARPAPLTREAFAEMHGASESDLDAVGAFAAAHGLAVLVRHPARRTITLGGTVQQMNAAFGVELWQFEHAGGTYRGLHGPVLVPTELADCVVAVLGLDNRPQARPHFRIRTGPKPRRSRAAAPRAAAFSAVELAALYGFPAGDGAGQCIALIELGGGYRPADLRTYFGALSVPLPAVVAVSVDQALNAPTGNPNSADGEVMLDIEVAGAIAPAATIAVYFAPNTDAGFLNALTTAVHDTVHRPSVISISWGGPEPSWSAQALRAMDQAFQAAAALGITVCVAAGDGGATDGAAGGVYEVDFPASSPHALACGGTRVTATANAIVSETVWNDGTPAAGATGGGVSGFFALPAWQEGLQTTDVQGATQLLPRRGVPDVAADADPRSGYQIVVDGVSAVFGGTSAVAPLWAGLIARLNAAGTQPAGWLNPLLYAHPAALRDITRGNNGGYSAAPGWDACTGLGSPLGARIAALPGV
ncbi:MAG: S53 family peptidase [Pseudomonadota bacterium]|jgi:kumamolisin|nr:S53 family peptidase [Pseudomonadota bacterium]